MNRKNKWLLPLLLLTTFFVLDSCKTKEKVGSKVALVSRAKEERIEVLKSKSLLYNTFASSLSLNFKVDSKNKNTSLNAQLKIKKNEVIQLSIRVIGIEAVKIIVTPEQILIIDRWNKKYLAESMKESHVGTLFDFDFYSLQALLTNHIFIAGKSDIESEDYDSFKLKEDEFTASLINTDSHDFHYDFLSDYTNRITQTKIYKNKEEFNLNWYYQNFEPISNRRLFPMKMNLEFKFPEEMLFLDLLFSSVEIDSSFDIDTTVPYKYQKISIEQFTKLIQSL
jgi:hypothetical protein